MIFLNLQKWWNQNGYTLIFLFGFCFIIVVYLLWNRNQSTGTSTYGIQDVLSRVFDPAPEKKVMTPVMIGTDHVASKRSKGESRCKEFLEFLYKKPFDTIRPSFLTNPVTGHALELDLFNQELGIAVEYNGSQHYHFNDHMHQKSKDKFHNQQYRDYMKRQLCAQHNIHLIIVPYTIKPEDIPAFLYKKLKERNLLPDQIS